MRNLLKGREEKIKMKIWEGWLKGVGGGTGWCKKKEEGAQSKRRS
jgi:hypothetical protein